jgi:hypothetical protein
MVSSRRRRQAPNQRSKLPVRQQCEPQHAGVQPLELALRHRVEVDAPNTLLGTRALQPTKQNLGSTGIGDRAITQTTLDLRITRRLALKARCTAPSMSSGPVQSRPHGGEPAVGALGRALDAYG